MHPSNNISIRANTSDRRKLASLCLSLFVLLLLVIPKEMQAQERISHIYTDYLGFWSSGVNNLSSIKPDYSHNLLGFTIGGKTYSTGVSDATLTAYGVEFQSGNYQALPVVNIEITSGGDRYAMFGEMQDGLHDGVLKDGSMPFPYPESVTLYDMLTDGVQGLDISTGVTNMKDGSDLVEMEFPTAIENEANIGDGVPDILVTQTAQPNSTIDEIWFTDAKGNMVEGSNIISINQQKLDPLGQTRNDFYDPVTKEVGNSFINSERDLRISAYEISEFGINATNFDQAKRLIYKMGGSSDPAFVAFNTELIKILVANNDVVQMDINTVDKPNEVEIDILDNDHFPSQENLLINIEDDPSNGIVTIDASSNKLIYVPEVDFTGVDTFKYEVCQEESCDIALVTVVVGAADLEVTKAIDKPAPEIGEEVNFTVGVRNLGPFEAIAVRVNDLLPAGYTMESFSVSSGSYSALTGVWFLGTLSASEPHNSATLQMKVTVNGTGPYTNTAVAESVNYDPNLENNEASVSPGTLLSASMEVGCSDKNDFQQVMVELKGEKPWTLTYNFGDAEEDIVQTDIEDDVITIPVEAQGRFYLKSVEDRFGNKIEYPISPAYRKQVNPCYVVSNPRIRSRAKKI